MDVEKFGGFTPPVSNYFRMPNEWINICAGIKSLAELKIVQYVLRHTWGFQEYDGNPKPITTDEFMHGKKRKDGSRMDDGTGLSDRGVKDGVALAIGDGYLVCVVDDRDKARIKKSYGLKMFSDEPDRKNLPPKQSGRKNSPISDRKNLPAEVKKVPIDKEEFSYRSEKETKEKYFKKEKEKETAEPQTSPVPNDLSLPLSQKNIEEETKPLEVDYPLFDRLCQEKGYAPDFKVPRNDKNNTAIQELRSQAATPEQVEFVFNDIWNDKDPFWQQHRGKPSTIASQFTARVWKMTAPTTKRPTLTGTPNYTEARIGVSAQEAKPAPVLHIVKTEQPKPTYGPKLDQTPTYTRLKLDKPARGRTLEARLQQEKEQK
jgi:hypothetical protein